MNCSVYLPFSGMVLLEDFLISLPFSRSLRFNICIVAVAYRGLLFRIGLVGVDTEAFILEASARCLDLLFQLCEGIFRQTTS